MFKDPHWKCWKYSPPAARTMRLLGFIQPCISQVSRVHMDLLLDLFSSSAMQMENHSGQKDIFWLDTAEFIGRVCSLRGMNKEESKLKVGIIYSKSFLKVSPKTMVDYYVDFKLHRSSLSVFAFKFSGAKRMLLQAPETHLNRQEICI